RSCAMCWAATTASPIRRWRTFENRGGRTFWRSWSGWARRRTQAREQPARWAVPLDATAVGRTLAQGAAKANAQAKAAGEHEHKATEIWTRTASGMGHQGATDLLHLPPNDFTSTPLSAVPGALKMQAGDLGGAVADIGKA